MKNKRKFFGPFRRLWLAVAGLTFAVMAAEASARWLWPSYSLSAIRADVGRFNPDAPGHLPSGILGLERNPAADPRVKANGFRSRHSAGFGGGYKILFIGDSLAEALTDSLTGPVHGQAAEDALTATAGRPVEIWDFSGSGYDMEHYRRILEYKCRHFKPDALVVVFCLNDALNFHIPVIFRKGDRLFMMQGVTLTKGWKINSFLFHWSHLYRTGFLFRYWRKMSLEGEFEAAGRYAETIRYIDRWAKENGVKPYFVIFPLFKPESDYTELEKRALKTTLEALSETQVPTLRLWEKFPKEYWKSYRNQLDPADDIHPNMYGYAKARELIIDFLKENWAAP